MSGGFSNPSEETLAVAESWASVDGNLDQFKRERDENISLTDPRSEGRYEGYIADAEGLMQALANRGFKVVRK